MKQFRPSRTYALALSLSLLLAPLPLPAIVHELFLSEDELSQLIDNHHSAYVCIDKQLSDIAYIAEQISFLDSNPSSPIGLLHRHIAD